MKKNNIFPSCDCSVDRLNCFFAIFIVLVIALDVGGCATKNPRYQLYSGSQIPKSNVTTITAHPESELMSFSNPTAQGIAFVEIRPYIKKIDAHEDKHLYSNVKNTNETTITLPNYYEGEESVEVLPGDYSLQIGFSCNNIYYTCPGKFEINARPNDIYRVEVHQLKSDSQLNGIMGYCKLVNIKNGNEIKAKGDKMR